MRISDWSSDVCSSDRWAAGQRAILETKAPQTMKVSLRLLHDGAHMASFADEMAREYAVASRVVQRHDFLEGVRAVIIDKDNAPRWNPVTPDGVTDRSEEHTSELQSLMRISYAVFCLKKKTQKPLHTTL